MANENYNPGDLVKVTTDENTFEGAVLERPDIIKGEYLIIKLSHGYNIGIDKNKIKSIELLGKAKSISVGKKTLKKKEGLPSISILSTGGTISSKIDYKSGGVSADYTAEDFVAMCPELADIANLKAKKIMAVMSEDMGFDDWKQIGNAVKEELDTGADGIVITQGTDTLHFSTAALSFILSDLDKPVVFTAAQRSIDRGSSDAFMNLICSVAAAAKSDIAEVVTCLHGTTNDDYCILNRGTKVRKMHTSRRDAFRPINDIPIAKVFVDGTIEYLQADYKKATKEKTGMLPKSAFEEKVALLNVYPAMNPEIIDFYIGKGYKGLVIAATALGHVPTNNKKYSLIPFIEKAQKAGMIIVIATQTLYGRVHPYVYSNLRKLSIELDCIFANDMLSETAYVKLSWVLGQTQDKEEVRKMMEDNIANEYTKRTLPESFLY
jgi:glutamyl-tRNA(Gln) amidotransferase subunit D